MRQTPSDKTLTPSFTGYFNEKNAGKTVTFEKMVLFKIQKSRFQFQTDGILCFYDLFDPESNISEVI